MVGKKKNSAEEKSLEKSVLGEGGSVIKRWCTDLLSNNDKDISDVGLNTDESAAWHDDDDDDEKMKLPSELEKFTRIRQDGFNDALRQTFVQSMGSPAWAKITKSTEQQDHSYENDESINENDTLQRCGNMIKRSSSLKKGTISIHRVRDLTREVHTDKMMNVVKFHPTSTVALLAGPSGTASIVQVDGVKNSKLQNVKFSNFPIHCGHFSSDGEQFIIGSRMSSSFYYYDMMCGKSIHVPVHQHIKQSNMSNFQVSPDGRFIAACGNDGYIHLYTGRSKEWICDLKMNEEVSALAFNNTGTRMFSHGGIGEVYEWDMNSRCCINRFYDSCVRGTSIAISPDDKFIACGSNNGTVNLYQYPFHTTEPFKVLYNMVTEVTSLRYNCTSELLVMASRFKPNAVKMVHFPSMTVFSNFPDTDSAILKPQAIDFSPSGGFFSVGNNNGNVLLYRLTHFKNY